MCSRLGITFKWFYPANLLKAKSKKKLNSLTVSNMEKKKKKIKQLPLISQLVREVKEVAPNSISSSHHLIYASIARAPGSMFYCIDSDCDPKLVAQHSDFISQLLSCPYRWQCRTADSNTLLLLSASVM